MIPHRNKVGPPRNQRYVQSGARELGSDIASDCSSAKDADGSSGIHRWDSAYAGPGARQSAEANKLLLTLAGIRNTLR